MSRLRLLALVAVLGSAAVLAPTPAAAQPAAALGHPLPAADMNPGEVSVRVIIGSIAKPAIGYDVTLAVAGTPRSARTDSAGRAYFKELPVGAQVQATIKDAEGKDVQSDAFPVPAQGGVHVMLTTVPIDPAGMAGGGAPFAGGGGAGGGGMPEPRKISGTPRPEQANPPGTLTVRVVYDEMGGKEPNIPVTLVAYGADGTVADETKQTDANGRATFPGLDVSGSVAYYAMAQVPRNDKLDRLVSTPVVLMPQVGVALLLSSEKKDSTAPAVDDQSRLDRQNPDLAAGKVEVALDGDINGANQVTLVDFTHHRVVAHVLPDRFPPDPTDISANADFKPRPDEKAGTFDIVVHGGGGSTDKPLPDIAVAVYAAEDTQLASPTNGTTNASGAVHFDLAPGTYRAQIMVNGKPLGSQPIDLTAGGAALAVLAQWDATGRPRALFDGVPVVPGQTLYAETVSRAGATYRSAPFQLVADHGTSASIREAPVFYTFHIVTGVEDQLLAVQGQFTLMNFSWAPYKETPDGLDIPLPRGFKGATIAERDQQIAAVAAGIGFRVPRPLAPAGPTVFHAAFSLPVEDGSVSWAQDLPHGTVESWIRMVQLPGMTVEAPAGANGTTVDSDEGPVYQIPRITIPEGRSMVLALHGLPQPPAWKVWLPRLIGLLVLALMIGGVGLAVIRGAGSPKAVGDSQRAARRNKLLDELVELERSGKDPRRRESLLTELEKLWDDDAA